MHTISSLYVCVFGGGAFVCVSMAPQRAEVLGTCICGSTCICILVVYWPLSRVGSVSLLRFTDLRSQFADQDEQTREDMKKEKRRYLLLRFPYK